jgi:hypothetical protein
MVELYSKQRFSFVYHGHIQALVDFLKVDSFFESDFTKAVQGVLTARTLTVRVVSHKKQSETGVRLISYNRVAITFSYCDQLQPEFGTVCFNLEMGGGENVLGEVYENLKAKGIPGGALGSTAYHEPEHIARRSLSGQDITKVKLTPEQELLRSPRGASHETHNSFDIDEVIAKIVNVLDLGKAEKRKLISGGQCKEFYRKIRNKLQDARYLNLARAISAHYLV